MSQAKNHLLWGGGGGVHKVTINLIKLDISVFAIHTNTFGLQLVMSVKLWDKETEPGSSVPKSRNAIFKLFHDMPNYKSVKINYISLCFISLSFGSGW